MLSMSGPHLSETAAEIDWTRSHMTTWREVKSAAVKIPAQNLNKYFILTSMSWNIYLLHLCMFFSSTNLVSSKVQAEWKWSFSKQHATDEVDCLILTSNIVGNFYTIYFGTI